MIDRLASKHRCVRDLLEEMDTLRSNVEYYERELARVRTEKRATFCRSEIDRAKHAEERATKLQDLWGERAEQAATNPNGSVKAFIETVLPGGGPWPKGMVVSGLMPANEIGGRFTMGTPQVSWANGSCTWCVRPSGGGTTRFGAPTASRAVRVLNDANRPDPKRERRAKRVRAGLGVE